MPEENTPAAPPQAFAVLIKTPFQLNNAELTAVLRASRRGGFHALRIPDGARVILGKVSAPIAGWGIIECRPSGHPLTRCMGLPEDEARRRVARLNAGCASGFHALN